MERALRRHFWSGGVGTGAILVAAAVAFVWPILLELDHWGIHDWDYHTAHLAVPRASLLEHGQIPLWNPYNWSGVPLLANPESRVLSPTFVLTLLFGEIIAIKLEILLFLVIALLGSERLLREHGASRVAALTGAFVFAFNGWYAVQLSVGHIWALNIAYLPWLMLYFRRSLRAWSNVIPAALLLTLMLFGGGTYPIVISLVLLAAFVACHALFGGERPLRHAASLGAIGLVSVPLGAIKLLPSAELLLAHPRLEAMLSGYQPATLLRALFDRTQALGPAFAMRPQDFNQGIMHEGLYLGVVPALLFMCGIAARRRSVAALAASAAIVLWLSLGGQVWPSAWSALRSLPILESTRIAERLGIGAMLPLAIVAGLGLDSLTHAVRRAWGRPRLAQGLAIAIALLVAADLISVGSRVLRDAFTIPAREVQRTPVFRQYGQVPAYDAKGAVTAASSPFTSTSSGLYPAFLANRGSTRGYLILPTPSSAITARSPFYRGEVFLDANLGTASFRRWSPNRLEIELAVEAPDHLVVNQNFDPGWRIEAANGRVVESRRGLLAVPVSPADRSLTLYYRPTSFVVGASVSGLALIGVALGTWQQRKRRGAAPTSTAE